MKPSMDENNSIVVFNSCYSKDAGENGASISDACGGRLRLGFSDVAHGWDASEAVETLLKAMNGNDPLDTDSPFRKAEFAVPYTEEYLESHKAAMYVENIIICDGNLNTTLCPAPIANTPFFTNFSKNLKFSVSSSLKKSSSFIIPLILNSSFLNFLSKSSFFLFNSSKLFPLNPQQQ